MSAPSSPPENQARPPSEVRPYLLRLVLTILVGVVLMASIATWAWKTYGGPLKDAPPLPEGKPYFDNSRPGGVTPSSR